MTPAERMQRQLDVTQARLDLLEKRMAGLEEMVEPSVPIPRIPDFSGLDEPKRGMCWECGHIHLAMRCGVQIGIRLDCSRAVCECEKPRFSDPEPGKRNLSRLAPLADKHWLIYFDDRDMPPEIFTIEDAARESYRRRQQTWNCYLFEQVADPEPGKRDALRQRGENHGFVSADWRNLVISLRNELDAAEQEIRILRQSRNDAPASLLRSCAQTIRENFMNGNAAEQYLLKYADTIEKQGESKL